jgi:hypothetical protein
MKILKKIILLPLSLINFSNLLLNKNEINNYKSDEKDLNFYQEKKRKNLTDEIRWETYTRLNLFYDYNENWFPIKSLTFSNPYEVIIKFLNDNYHKYLKPKNYSEGIEHFDRIRKNYQNWVNQKPIYTNYFLIKVGFDKSSYKQIDFTAFGYNRNGDPHYHGNATLIKNFAFPEKIFIRLDELDKAKEKDEGKGYGSHGHHTGVNWSRFKFFPNQETIFEVRGLDQLPLKIFYNSNKVFKSQEINQIFQPERFKLQETKIHIELDIDTQYDDFMPLLYVSNWNNHSEKGQEIGINGSFVNLGWNYGSCWKNNTLKWTKFPRNNR